MHVTVCEKIGERRLNVITEKQFRSTRHCKVEKILCRDYWILITATSQRP